MLLAMVQDDGQSHELQAGEGSGYLGLVDDSNIRSSSRREIGRADQTHGSPLSSPRDTGDAIAAAASPVVAGLFGKEVELASLWADDAQVARGRALVGIVGVHVVGAVSVDDAGAAPSSRTATAPRVEAGGIAGARVLSPLFLGSVGEGDDD